MKTPQKIKNDDILIRMKFKNNLEFQNSDVRCQSSKND